MALIYRGERPYLYRSERRGGRVTSRFVAAGESAVLIARMNEIERDEKDYRRHCVLEERRQLDDLEHGLDELVDRARTLAAEGEDGDAVPTLLPVPDGLVAGLSDGIDRDLLVRSLELLQARDVWLRLGEPA
jgi:hypothetical protein